MQVEATRSDHRRPQRSRRETEAAAAAGDGSPSDADIQDTVRTYCHE